ncbi:MAG TPA: polysaccharide deacetylase family protein [Nocardioidaceae bacterium]|nr:polysaccharide deacetylase family protein [Nocardioidaceae bacterium]
MTILCYHAIEPRWTSPLAVDPEAFAAQCDWLAYTRQVLPLHEAVDRLDRSGRLPRGMAALTFDDGFAGLYEHAMPVVARYRLPMTVFLVAQTLTAGGKRVDWVDTPPDYELTTLDEQQVLEMQSMGVSFQSHSYAHVDLTSLSFEACVEDLRSSRELLESLLHRPVRMLAYPRGRHDEGVRAAARQAGYTWAFTLPEGPERRGPYAIPRVGIYHGNSVRSLQVKSARSYLPLRTGRGYDLAKRAQRALHRGSGS